MRRINGIVRDNNKSPLVNANVCVAYFNGNLLYDKGKPMCTSTNKNGEYLIDLPEEFNNIVVSNIGFKKNLIDVNDYLTTKDGVINFSMEMDNTVLNEFTTTQQKPDITKTKDNWWKKQSKGTKIAITLGVLAILGLGTYAIIKAKNKK